MYEGYKHVFADKYNPYKKNNNLTLGLDYLKYSS